MSTLTKYLEHIHNSEAVGGFAIDSVHTGKPLPKWVYSQRHKRPGHLGEDTIEEKPVLLVDFDGTIHKYSRGWQDGSAYDDPMDKAKEAIDDLKDRYTIIIFTTRVSKGSGNNIDEQKKYVEDWLNEHDIHFDGITADKIPCFRMIDDKAIKFTDWNQVINDVEESENLG